MVYSATDTTNILLVVSDIEEEPKMKTTVTARPSNYKLFVKVDKGYDVSLKVADAVKAIKNYTT